MRICEPLARGQKRRKISNLAYQSIRFMTPQSCGCSFVKITRVPKRTQEMIDDNVFMAEAIIAERTNMYGKYEFLIKWAGCPLKASTWEPYENIADDLSTDWFYKKVVLHGTQEGLGDAAAKHCAGQEETAFYTPGFLAAARQAYLQMVEIAQDNELLSWERGEW